MISKENIFSCSDPDIKGKKSDKFLSILQVFSLWNQPFFMHSYLPRLWLKVYKYSSWIQKIWFNKDISDTSNFWLSIYDKKEKGIQPEKIL